MHKIKVTRNGKTVWKHGPGNTGRLSRNLYVMLKFTKRPKTLGITLKNMACSERNQLSPGDFRINIDETNADMVQFTKLQRDGTGNGFSNIKDTFAESLQLQMSVRR